MDLGHQPLRSALLVEGLDDLVGDVERLARNVTEFVGGLRVVESQAGTDAAGPEALRFSLAKRFHRNPSQNERHDKKEKKKGKILSGEILSGENLSGENVVQRNKKNKKK